MLIAFITLRVAVDALIARLGLGARGGRRWRATVILVGADVPVGLCAVALLEWAGSPRLGLAVRHNAYLALSTIAVALVISLVIWGRAVRFAARPSTIAPDRAGKLAALLLLTIPAIAAVAALPWLTYGSYRAYSPAGVTRWQVRVAGLPRAFDGLRVCCVSDLHLGPNADADAIRARLRPMARLKPDLILFLGDYASTWPRGQHQAAQIMAQYEAPLGVYAILGNHDRWLGEGHALRALREAGVRSLVNEHITLTRGRDTIYLAGLNDPFTGAADFGATFAGIPKGACVVLMSHTPDVIDEAEARGAALVVAGHTHGGQVCLPFLGAVIARSEYGRRYAHGLFYRDGTALFVTRGVGEIAPYVRFNCPREIALLTLRRR
jgi:predicted MPP superfamily phosphohydrolase